MVGKVRTLIITRLLAPALSRLPQNVWRHLLTRERVVTKAGELKLTRELLADLFIRGRGLEIGAFNSPLAVPAGVEVKYVDRATADELQDHVRFLGDTDNPVITPPDIVDDGHILSTIPDGSQDFIISCHVLEHCEDPIAAVGNWLRVLRPNGIAFIALPDKRFTFDVDRSVTQFSHLLRDHNEGPQWSRRAHFEEMPRVILGEQDESRIKALADYAEEKIGHTHFHCWTQADMFEMFASLRNQCDLEFDVIASSAVGNEVIFILRKGDAGHDRSMAEESLRAAREDAQHILI